MYGLRFVYGLRLYVWVKNKSDFLEKIKDPLKNYCVSADLLLLVKTQFSQSQRK